ncbi:hypothetical protein SpCBS45565_g02925 [Spizellomyces sp. 'palustris']|nr:hypothetical protein SpCBS45565_g02925 [Spizellomyces sp. 'palustris']
MTGIPSMVQQAPKRTLEDSTSDNTKRVKLDDSIGELPSTGISVTSPHIGDMVDLVAARKLVTEQDVGITAFVDPSIPGFRGILKTRFTDFQVNEVTLDGQIVHLQSTDPPQDVSKAGDEAKEEVKDEERGFAELTELIQDAAFITSFKGLIESLKNGAVPSEGSSVTVTEGNEDGCVKIDDGTEPTTATKGTPTDSLTCNISDKSVRRQVHMIIKQHFGDLIETQGGETSIVFVPQGTDSGKRSDRRPGKGQKKGWNKRGPTKRDWEARGGQYCEFTLYKENKDTINAINMIAKTLRMNSKTFSYAGTKDKRAVTTQKITACRVNAERLGHLNKCLRGMALGDFRYRPDQIVLGDLSGNHFKISYREVQMESQLMLEKAMESLRCHGFINYFGMQRFGTRSTPTYAVGISCLKGDFEKAVNEVMDIKEGEREEFVKARQHWEEHRDPEVALELFPKACLAERSIIGFFKNTSRFNDYLNALEAIPRNLRTLYLHAYQSLVWNNMASERLRMYGAKPVLGDIVELSGQDDSEELDDSTADVLGNEDAVAALSELEAKSKKRDVQVAILETDDDLEKYTMDDVVLPLPGHSVTYPANEMKDKYVNFMAQHGLDPHHMVRKQKTFSLPGSYRKILAKPKHFDWKLLRYDDPEMDLQLTDMDRVAGKPEPESKDDGKRVAVVLEFTLASSQYATMALRECMKVDTTSAHHEQLAQYYGSQGKQTKETAESV